MGAIRRSPAVSPGEHHTNKTYRGLRPFPAIAGTIGEYRTFAMPISLFSGVESCLNAALEVLYLCTYQKSSLSVAAIAFREHGAPTRSLELNQRTRPYEGKLFGNNWREIFAPCASIRCGFAVARESATADFLHSACGAFRFCCTADAQQGEQQQQAQQQHKTITITKPTHRNTQTAQGAAAARTATPRRPTPNAHCPALEARERGVSPWLCVLCG